MPSPRPPRPPGDQSHRCCRAGMVDEAIRSGMNPAAVPEPIDPRPQADPQHRLSFGCSLAPLFATGGVRGIGFLRGEQYTPETLSKSMRRWGSTRPQHLRESPARYCARSCKASNLLAVLDAERSAPRLHQRGRGMTAVDMEPKVNNGFRWDRVLRLFPEERCDVQD